ncbi:MAG: hypothetical protein M0R70_12805 [Nitrospirae bacterium]|nr:hypothetical protein [Nitrospirota bacterium]
MAIVHITGEMLYRMHRLKREMAEKKKRSGARRSKWILLAAAAMYILMRG